MATFHGFLFSKLANLGTKSEGPEYFLQQEDGDELHVIKNARAWQGDPALHPFVGKKVTIEGQRRAGILQYREVREFDSRDRGGRTTVSSSGNPTLEHGDMGANVLELQRLLNEKGLAVVRDGFLGSVTIALVKEFQEANGLPSTGVVDSATWDALRR